MATAMAGCDGVFHVAGIFDPSPGGESAMRSLHVDATVALVGAAKDVGITKFLTCSSSITVGFGTKEAPGHEDTPIDPDLIYGRSGALRAYYDSKLESERLTIEAGGVVVCPDYVLGAWDVKPTSGQLLLTLAKGFVPAYPTGGKCFVDADDCAIGHIRALEVGTPGRRYLLGNWNLSYREFMALGAYAAGKTAPFLPVPKTAMRLAGALGGVLQRYDAHRFAGMEKHVLLAMMQHRYRTGKRSWDELSVPRTPMEETVRKTLGWFQEHGYLA